MDKLTKFFYAHNAQMLGSFYQSQRAPVLVKIVEKFFSSNAKLLDIGAGSGRDMDMLLQKGFDIYGVDAVGEMVDSALSRYPSLAKRMVVAQLPFPGIVFGGAFDGILTSALWMHIADSSLALSVSCAKRQLRNKGKIVISVPRSRPDLDSESRSRDGRIFYIRTPEFYVDLIDAGGFREIFRGQEMDALGREGYEWSVQVFEG